MTGWQADMVGAVPNIGTGNGAMPLNGALGGNVKLVSDFKGMAEIRLAMKSNEVDNVIMGGKTLRVTNLQKLR